MWYSSSYRFHHFHSYHGMAVSWVWQQTAFTLIELLLALLMFSIITTAVFATFSAISNGVEHGRQRIERIHVGLAARQRLLQEISSAYRMQHSDCNRERPSDERPAYLCEPLKGEDLTGPDSLPRDRIMFLTIPLQYFPAQQARSELCQVCYFIDQDAEGHPALFRYEDCRLGGEGESDDRCSGHGAPLELTDAIVGMNIVYYDRNDEDMTEDDAMDVWPSPDREAAEPPLPCRVHISLMLRDAPPDETIEATVALPMQNACETTTDDNRSTTDDNRNTTGDHRNTTGDHRNTTDDHRSTTGDHRITTDDNRSTTGDHRGR